MTEDQIKHMVDRFLGWKLPENFNPDDGISFKRTFNDHLPTPSKHEPSGTNLFDATQADAMVRYMIEGLPAASGTVAGTRITAPSAEDDALLNSGITSAQQNASGTEQASGMATLRKSDALDSLRNEQSQLDEDGVYVGVSRQALDEVLAMIDAASPPHSQGDGDA
jgi:hypothetical protein